MIRFMIRYDEGCNHLYHLFNNNDKRPGQKQKQRRQPSKQLSMLSRVRLRQSTVDDESLNTIVHFCTCVTKGAAK